MPKRMLNVSGGGAAGWGNVSNTARAVTVLGVGGLLLAGCVRPERVDRAGLVPSIGAAGPEAVGDPAQHEDRVTRIEALRKQRDGSVIKHGVATEQAVGAPVLRLLVRQQDLCFALRQGQHRFGDVNQDNRVDAADEQLIRSHIGTPVPGGSCGGGLPCAYLHGDLNADGAISDADVQLARGALGSPCCLADFNLDGTVDDADLRIFVAAYEQYSVPPAEERCDLNGDGVVDDVDFAIFSEAYVRGRCW